LDRATGRDVPALTQRRLEVLKLLFEGKSVKEIGTELYLSQATVTNHVRSLLQALGAHFQLEVLAKARELGLLSS
jgi:DNA-binding NarL/FixJ family response regulator